MPKQICALYKEVCTVYNHNHNHNQVMVLVCGLLRYFPPSNHCLSNLRNTYKPSLLSVLVQNDFSFCFILTIINCCIIIGLNQYEKTTIALKTFACTKACMCRTSLCKLKIIA